MPPSSVDTRGAEDDYEPGTQFRPKVRPVRHSPNSEAGIRARRCCRGNSTSRKMDTSGSQRALDVHWGTVIDVLSRERKVVSLDYSGSGDTVDDGGPLTLEKLSRQVVGVAKAVGAETFDLIGYSLGSVIATFVTAEYPKLVRSVVLLTGFCGAEILGSSCNSIFIKQRSLYSMPASTPYGLDE
jgi:alpha/beta hydrolase fold